MFSLVNLSSEMLEQILVQLDDVEDVVSLGSTCLRLTGILSNLRIWRIVLAKTELVEQGGVMEDRMRTLAAFLSSLPESEGIFSLLRKTIYERYPGTCMDRFTVSFPADPQHHTVSLCGLQLLVLADREIAGHTILKAYLAPGWINHLPALASLQKEIGELVMGLAFCYTDEDGMVLCSVLKKCTSWRLGWLILKEEVGGETWRRLGREVARGRLGVVHTSREVLRRGRREDLRILWGKGENDWQVDGEVIEISDEEVGWRGVEEMIL